MSDKNSYYINNPIFVKYKSKFNFSRLSRKRQISGGTVNERIVEIPFVLGNVPYQPSKILELGCAESSLAIHLATIGHEVTGVDVRVLPYKHPNFLFVQTDIMNMSFYDKYFDVVNCISTLEHIGLGFYKDKVTSDKPDVLAMNEIHRVLKPKGMLLLSIPFGIPKFTAQQRIYDLAMIEPLLSNFDVKLSRYFVLINQGDSHYWQEFGQKEAATIESKDGSTNCVCLIKAEKKH
ncbi:MAG: class I SAM-dependent methyltransferase [Candidatus Omnitrophica bacterium]|nr:class I SAM-dependent methyltransferase [Candidatus Omnitrophota bacterium]